MTQQLFCFGLGFTARQIAADYPDWEVLGTSRTPPLDGETSEFSIFPFRRGSPIPDFSNLTKEVSHILLSIPPDDLGDPVYDEMREQIVSLPNLKWIGYLSTTGVYGDLDGGWVDEESPYNPSGKRGERRMLAEKAWRGLYETRGLPLHIFRLPGIYGPGRNQLVSLKNGKARRIEKPGQVFSRIHVADLAAILVASMKKPNPGAIYNVADDEPAPPQEVVSHAAELLGITPPPLVDFDVADLSPMARSFYSDSKRVGNSKIKSELGISLKFPTYREGLAALLPGETRI
ncbi:SDR family oxidoreductase [uncultured Sneathiella sp.]|jgi:nucleoside-diphosphate-sugar epimerase|uniref:SDR family oxidoreductase n=1 Tax=uncultured Sneathiella sp. TaxID=879315 RepID=UPI0030D92191|tara:strand:- start:28253 stop:29119 length:867 start_codon:yes stop_codon:yes gene_type:complete